MANHPLLLAEPKQNKIENIVNIMAETKASTSYRFLFFFVVVVVVVFLA